MTAELEPVHDVSVGAWIAPRLLPFGGRVGGNVPTAFAAYARLLHPVESHDGQAPTRWDGACAQTGSVAHALMQWRSIATANVVCEPDIGRLEMSALGPLLDVLAAFTPIDDECFHAMWEGWGFLPAATSDSAPRLEHPGRGYLLFRGPLRAALTMGHWPTPEWFLPQSPSIIWPADRSWCVATEVDFDSTLVGGTAGMVDALLADARLEAWRVAPGDDLSSTGDTINAGAG